MYDSLTSKTISSPSPSPSPSSRLIDTTTQCKRPRCRQQRASRPRAKSFSSFRKGTSKHESSCSQCSDQSPECVGHPLGSVTVFQTSAIASALANETVSPHGKCHADAPCYLHRDQESSHSELDADKAMSKAEGLGVSHKRSRRQSHPPKHQRHQRQRQDLQLEQPNSAHPTTMSCTSCRTEETPRWREGPAGPRTLCNFCGLLYAKRQQKCHSAPSSHCFTSD
ncbi:uncharacterized protein FMAN_14562 [Fusarium mangiferae]|uniref:GATA-type domain-containing protein n=1 Tax=Fusarium mangiferae TaxID=192010 RepID=A0A1L7UAD2_FUSMA|nr:uncharacterized protein FMAN_14562 [Fusarium mangiferae]CVL07684.1 uncharacterized protein FMAN_14562 [Fusarium mangiferae]